MKILTLNTWGDRGPWRQRWKLIVQGVREINPDIVAFQELFDPRWAQEVKRLLGYPTALISKVHSGLAVYTRLRAWGWGVVPLPPSPLEEYGRYVLWAEMKNKDGGRPFYFFNTHLSWKIHDGESRRRQLREITALVRYKTAPFQSVLTGDLNCGPTYPEFRWFRLDSGFRDTFTDAHGKNEAFTWDNRNTFAAHCSHAMPNRRIDHILVRGKAIQFEKVASCDLVFDRPRGGIWPSDHLGVCTRFV